MRVNLSSQVPLRLAVPLATVILAALFLLAKSFDGGQARGSAHSLQPGENPGSSAVTPEQVAAGRGRANVEAKPADPPDVVQLVDATFGFPLRRASMSLDGVTQFASEPVRFSTVHAQPFLPGTVFRAAGYEDFHVIANASAPKKIRMRPSKAATVVVRHQDGQAPVGGRVTWRALSFDGASSKAADRVTALGVYLGKGVQKETDGIGMAQVDTAVAVEARIEHPSLSFAITKLVEPGQSVLAVLPTCGVEVQFLDHSGAPLRGLALEYWSPSDLSGTTVRVSTDGHGVVEVPVVPAGFLLRLPGAIRTAMRFDDIGHSGVSAESEGGDWKTVLRFHSVDCGARVVIRLQRCAPVFMVLDAATNERLSGKAYVSPYSGMPVEVPGGAAIPPRPWRSVGAVLGTGKELEIADGELSLPCYRAANPQVLQGEPGSMVISVDGYEPVYLDKHEFGALVSEPTVEHTVHVHKCPTVALRIVLADSNVYRGRVRVKSVDHNAYIYTGTRANREGVRTFSWYGGPIEVEVQGASFNLRPTPPAVTELVLPRSSASIKIVGVPEEALVTDLVALSEDGFDAIRFRPSRGEVGAVVFEGLPPASYVVGPIDWVECVKSQPNLPDGHARVTLRSGETALVPWSPSWTSSPGATGVVQVASQNGSPPFLVPAYSAQSSGRLVLGRTYPRVPVSHDGRYMIEVGAPLPGLLAVCRTNDGLWGANTAFHVLEFIEPGESLQLETRSVSLRWGGEAPPERVKVAYEVVTSEMRHPIETFQKRSELWWFPANEVTIRGIPLYVEALEVDGKTVAIPPGVQAIDVGSN